MEKIVIIWVGLLALAVGSFLNVVIHRVPRRIKFVNARSVCPHCDGQLKWYHNIPVISFLLLKGKCAFCSARISLRYPLVELLNMVFYVYFFHRFGLTLEFVVSAVLSSALLVIFFVDLDFQIIPDSITLPGMVVGLGVSLIPGGVSLLDSSIGLLVGGGSLFLIAILGDWLFKKESMGGGDVKMAAMLGAFLGWQKVLLVFISSAVIGLMVSIVLMLFSAKLRKTRVVPFGPFLATAAMLSILCGDRIIDLYLTHFLGMP